MFLDKNGNIVQKNMDGGDTAQRSGFLEVALRIKENLKIESPPLDLGGWQFQKQWPTLFIDKKLIRNPLDWRDPKDTSRDQSLCPTMAFGLNNMPEQVKWVAPKGFILKFYPNGDIASPENNAMVKRALGIKPPTICDLWAGASVAIRISQAKKNQDDVGDDLNALASFVYAAHVFPNKHTLDTLKVYLKERPVNFGVTKMGEKDPVMGALVWYFREETGGNMELAEAWRPIVSYYRLKLDCPVA